MSSQNRYYAPYMSDDEERSEASSDASSVSSEDSQLRGDLIDDLIGSPLSLVRAGGPTLVNTTKAIDLRVQPKKGIQYYPFDLSGDFDKTLPFTGTSFDMNTGIQTSILIINSRDRDRNVYPQPTFFTLRVPRIYKNITSFQILQLKLLSSFFYFRPDKENTSIEILEYGRQILNSSNVLVNNVITSYIRTGTYDITSLLNELQTQLNRTPLFFDYPNGIADFVPLFASTGDLSLGFNQPGDTYYDALRRKFVPNPTMAVIVSYYFPSQFAGLSSYTLQQIKYAYYYPVLYECYLDPEYGPSTLNLTLTTSSLLPGETIDQRILYTAQGLNDPVIAELINNNLANMYKMTNTNILDYYRLRHTFRYTLVNEYLCTYETFNNRINISSSNLNTSLVNLINLQSAKFLAAELQRLGLTTAQYSALQTAVSVNTAVLTNMYNFAQSNFATYFGVNFNTYAPPFFADVSNSLFIQNGVGATGVDTGYSLDVLQRGNTPITSSTSNLVDTKVYWPKLSNLSGTIAYPYNLPENSNIPYSVSTKSFVNAKFVDASGFIYVDAIQRAGDIVVPIEPAKYTVFRFRSPVRQNLQVETLPLPYYYRYPEYNATLGGNIASFFDVSYSYRYTAYNSNMDNIPNTFFTTIVPVFNRQYSVASNAATTYPLQVSQSAYYFKFQTPFPTDVTLDASGYTYVMNIGATAANTTFATPISMFLYQDRGAFMADVSGIRNEQAYHYKQTATATSDASMVQMNFRAYANTDYYVIFRSNPVSFANTSFKFFSWFTTPATQKIRFDLSGFNPYANPLDNLTNQTYAIVNDTNFIKLPTSSNLMGLDPSSSVFNSNLPISEPAIGYDISGALTYGGVSSDLTDYKGYLTATDLSNVPVATFRKDPTNSYTFQKLSSYDSNSQAYFYSGSSNAILKPYNNQPYARGTVNQRQFKIVHWYDYNYIPQQTYEQVPTGGQVATMTPYTSNILQLTGYTYYPTTKYIELGQGIQGFTFLPQDGVWSIESMFFKSAWNAVTDCSNDNIKYIGVYPTNQITNAITSSLALSNAISVLKYDSKYKYTSSQITSNGGFDARGGTYYKFVADSSFVLANSNLSLIGYSPGPPTVAGLLPDSSLYSFIAFNEFKTPTNMYLLAGSLVPFPDATDPSGTRVYNDTSGYPFPRYSPTGQEMINPLYKTRYNPLYGPPSGGNIYTSQYEQSFGIGTQALHYVADAAANQTSNGFYPFQCDPYSGTAGGGNNVLQSWKINGVSANYLYVTMPFDPYYSYTDSAAILYDISNPSRNLQVAFQDSTDNLAAPVTTFTTYQGTTTYGMTAFNSNALNHYNGNSNFRIYKDTGNYFQAISYVQDQPGIFPIFNDALTYSLTDSGAYAVVFTYDRAVPEIVPQLSTDPSPAGWPNPMTICYSSNGIVSPVTMTVKGLTVDPSGGWYFAPTSTPGEPIQGTVLGDHGCSVATDVVNNYMYFLPYDSFSAADTVAAGGNLYRIDLTKPPNDASVAYGSNTTATVGFTQNLVIYQFTGSPNKFTYVNYYKDGSVFLRTSANNTLYYISSSNLINQSSNAPSGLPYWSLYSCVVSPFVQTIPTYPATGQLGQVVTGAAGQFFVGYNSVDISGNTDTPPRYVAYTTAPKTYNESGTTLFNQTGYFFVTATGIGYNEYTLYTVGNGFAVPCTTVDQITVPPNYPWQVFYTEYGTWNPIGPYGVYQNYEQGPLRRPTVLKYNIYGNRNNSLDPIPKKILKNAWQIFYPNFKLNLTKKSNSSSPITNTTDLTTYPYYPHTSMFFYNSFNKMVSDISGLWAHEKKTNFTASDVSSGYFFMSYINTINLPTSTNFNNTDNNSYKYLAIRGYSPTEKFKCLVRFYLPGRYDFGYMSLWDIMNEAQKTVLVDLSGSALVNPSYYNALNLFNNSYKITSNFGGNSVPGFGGLNLTFTGFSNFETQYVTIYNDGLSNANLLNGITSNVLSNLRAWIQQYLGNILPSYVLQRDNFTSALTFSILWETALTPARRAMDDDWGLGYNLGFAKIDTPYSTVQRATSFFKILEDFIYLRLNQEFTMNRMDTCSREDLSVTHEPTGAVNLYAAKLLLAPFGNYATVLVQNPINFNPVLTSMDRLSFQWTDSSTTTIDNNECEWNAVVQIQEQVTAPRIGSTIPQPPKNK